MKKSHIELEIESVQVAGEQRHRDVTNRFDVQDRRLEASRNLLDANHTDLLDRLSQIPQIDDNTQRILSLVSSSQKETASSMVAYNDIVQQLSSQINTKLDALISQPLRQQSITTPGTNSGRSARSFQFDSFGFRTRRRGLCVPSCPCRCHSAGSLPYQWRLPQSTKFLFGSLFVQYTGWPVSLLSCDTNACYGTQSTRLEATYTFPAWFVWYNVCLLVGKTLGRNPEIVLTLRNRVRFSSSPLFGLFIMETWNSWLSY